MDKLNLTEHDFRLQDEGTIVVLHPLNDAARSWLDDHIYAGHETVSWWGGGVVIEHRYVADILAGITADGLDVEGLS